MTSIEYNYKSSGVESAVFERKRMFLDLFLSNAVQPQLSADFNKLVTKQKVGD